MCGAVAPPLPIISLMFLGGGHALPYSAKVSANKIVYLPVFIKIVLLTIGAGVINVSHNWHQDIGQHPSRYVSGYNMYLHAIQKKWFGL